MRRSSILSCRPIYSGKLESEFLLHFTCWTAGLILLWFVTYFTTSYTVLLGVSFLCGMLYYSMQVLWPRESALLFVSATDPIIRGLYANLTSWGSFGKTFPPVQTREEDNKDSRP